MGKFFSRKYPKTSFGNHQPKKICTFSRKQKQKTENEIKTKQGLKSVFDPMVTQPEVIREHMQVGFHTKFLRFQENENKNRNRKLNQAGFEIRTLQAY